MGTYSYADAAHKHAVTSTSAGWAYSYDVNGNMLHRDPPGSDDYDYVYDAENRLSQAKKNGSLVAEFTYDGDGARVKSVLGGVTTAFPSSDYELSGASVTKYYLAGGGRLAMRAGATLTYLFGDHLGSTAITASADGMLQSELRYKPWGRRVSCRAPLLPTGATPASAPKTLIY